ncbi:MAG TPA: hemolysin family protein [Acidimicrobiia bacterium]|nr:hemolysin family protein [Acidimicrobiia bacterium]
MDVNRDGPLIGLLILFFILAIVFAAAEMALARVSDVRLRTMAEAGDRRARRLVALLEGLPRVINAILLAVLLVQIGAATITGLLAERWFSNVGIVIATVVLTIVLFVYTEAIPKTYAFRHPTRVALALTYPVVLLEFVLRPIVGGLVWFADLHAPGKGVSLAPTITERELLSLAADAEQEGEITPIDRHLIERAFRLGDRTAEEVMVPRTDIVAVPAGESVDEAVTLAVRAGHRRLIVYEGDLDQITGVVYLRDLVRATGAAPPQTVQALTRPTLVVSEWKRVVELLRDMQAQGTHLAVVVDEYGGTAGIVTIEDIAEELLGAVADEGRVPSPTITRLSAGHWSVDGALLVDDLAEVIGVDLPEGEWTTLAGMVMGLAGEVPEAGDEVEVAGYRFRVELIEQRRIKRVDVRRMAT